MSDTEVPADSKQKPRQMMLQNQARIEWLDADGAVVNKELCLRGLGPLIDRLTRDVLTEDQKKQRVRITLMGTPEVEDKDGKPMEMVAIEDEWEKVATGLAKNLIDPRLVIMHYQKMSEQMAERGDLKALIFTGVFEGSRIAGFGFMSSVSDVSDSDIITMVEGAESQLKMFKDQMRKHRPNIKFKSDEEPSRIILPGR